ncbi:MAG: MBOAT family protein, partial [Bacteroidales bacterium]
MLFNSFEFALFLPIVFLLYWFVFNKNLKWQNIFILVASYLFYGWWDWRFLFLIAFTTGCSWYSGILIKKYLSKNNDKKARLISGLNIGLNIAMLLYFKYCNFFVESFTETFLFLGQPFNLESLEIILPVGISFYTFQALSYTIDVYRKKVEATHDAVSFFAFVSFFPQLVAGPIERASNLLPQFFQKRHFDHLVAVDGMRQMLWGMFKKVVVADNCATVVNQVFNNYQYYDGSTLFVG